MERNNYNVKKKKKETRDLPLNQVQNANTYSYGVYKPFYTALLLYVS